MDTKGIVVLMAAATAGAGFLAAAEPAVTTSRPTDRVAPFLKVIREVGDYRAVMRAYARACAIDRNDVRLHRAYMRRMLKLGLPQIAYYPALALTKLDPKDGTAWGVVGYVHGRRGRLADAFAATMRALATKPSDPSILHNAGQLAAWYDHDPSLPRVRDSARRALANLREKVSKNPIYARAYAEIAQAYKRQVETASMLKRALAAARAEVETARRRAWEVDRELRDLNDEIDYRNRLIDQLWRELRSYYRATRTYKDESGVIIVVPSRDTLYRQELSDRIRAEERAIERLRLKVRKFRREGELVLAQLARREAEVENLRKQARGHVVRQVREFRWDPPAVDGVVTPELERLPVATRPATVKLPIDPDSEAAQQLELAKLYLRHDMSRKALDILEGIVKQFPATKAGRQAKLLLNALQPAPPPPAK